MSEFTHVEGVEDLEGSRLTIPGVNDMVGNPYINPKTGGLNPGTGASEFPIGKIIPPPPPKPSQPVNFKPIDTRTGEPVGYGNNNSNDDGRLIIPGVNDGFFAEKSKTIQNGNNASGVNGNNSSPYTDETSWANADKDLIRADQDLINHNNNSQQEYENLKNQQVRDNEEYKNNYIRRQEDYYNEENKLIEASKRERDEYDREMLREYNNRLERGTRELEGKKEREVELLKASAERQRMLNDRAIRKAQVDTEIARVQSAWAYQKMGLGFSSGIINSSQTIATEGIQKLAELKVEANFQEAEIKNKIADIEFNYTQMINDNIDKYTDKMSALRQEMKQRVIDTNRSLLKNSYEKKEKITEITKWGKDEKYKLERQHLSDITQIKKDNVAFTRQLQSDVEHYQAKEAKKVEDAVNSGLITRFTPEEIASKEVELGLPAGTITYKYNNYIDKGLHSELTKILDGTAKDVNYGKMREEVKEYQRLGYGYEGAVNQVIRDNVQKNPTWKAYIESKELLAKQKLAFQNEELKYKALSVKAKAQKEVNGEWKMTDGYMWNDTSGQILKAYEKPDYNRFIKTEDGIYDLGQGNYLTQYQRDYFGNIIPGGGASVGTVNAGGVLGDLSNSEWRNKYKNEASFKNNNPAGLTYNPGKSPLKDLWIKNGVKFSDGGNRPSNEGGAYYKFASMADGLKAYQIALGHTNKNLNDRLKQWVGHRDDASNQKYATNILANAGLLDKANVHINKLTEDEKARLYASQLKAESGGLHKYLTENGVISNGRLLNFPSLQGKKEEKKAEGKNWLEKGINALSNFFGSSKANISAENIDPYTKKEMELSALEKQRDEIMAQPVVAGKQQSKNNAINNIDALIGRTRKDLEEMDKGHSSTILNDTYYPILQAKAIYANNIKNPTKEAILPLVNAIGNPKNGDDLIDGRMLLAELNLPIAETSDKLANNQAGIVLKEKKVSGKYASETKEEAKERILKENPGAKDVKYVSDFFRGSRFEYTIDKPVIKTKNGDIPLNIDISLLELYKTNPQQFIRFYKQRNDKYLRAEGRLRENFNKDDLEAQQKAMLNAIYGTKK